MSGGMAGLTRAGSALLEARGHLFPFLPVLLGIGIGLWFALPFEPGTGVYLPCAGLALAALALWLWGPEILAAPAVALLFLALGPLVAGYRAHSVAAPVLAGELDGIVMGRVTEIDRSASDALRVRLDRVWLSGIEPGATPAEVRIAFQGQEPVLIPGSVIQIAAHLSPPPGPVEPGAFDFRRMAWFQQLGALGYARDPPLMWQRPDPGSEWIGRVRMSLSGAIRAAVPGDAGAFAAGSMTGDRSGIGQETVKALRDSNLAHLLAISGMNLALVTGFVFFLVRGGLALVPVLALRLNGKKIAAVIALGAAGFYLALSGANVSTERAFLMVAVMLGAVMLDRRAVSLRAVAVSALVLLLLRPESLTEPGFQMSFAATIALIAGFRWLDGRAAQERLPRWLVPVYALVLSSLIGGFSTAPFAAAHFNRFADYGLVANLLTVPVMSILMAAGVAALLLAPFGLAGPALWVMGKAAEWILWVAHVTAGFEGAVTGLPAPPGAALPAFALGALWLVLWPGRARLAGAALAAGALLLWPFGERPVLLVEDRGALVGLLGAEGRALSRGRGAGFVATAWLENDGDLAAQKIAATRAGMAGAGKRRAFDPGGLSGLHLIGKAAGRQAAGLCGQARIIVTDQYMAASGDCLVLDREALAKAGAVALYRREGGYALSPARAAMRLWDGPGPAPDLPGWLPADKAGDQ